MTPDGAACILRPMTDEIRLAFLGGATIYQGDRKFEATATLFAEGPQPAESFFGHYDAEAGSGSRAVCGISAAASERQPAPAFANVPRTSRSARSRRLVVTTSLPCRAHAFATTSRTSVLSRVTASGIFARTRSSAFVAASSDSKTSIERPVLSLRVQYPATNPGACETRGTTSSCRRAVAASGSSMFTLTTTACMLASLGV